MSIDANGLISWTPTQLPGSYPVTIEVANAAGSTSQQFSIELAIAQSIEPIIPLLECVEDRGPDRADPAERYLARFGYNNPNSFAVAIEIDGRQNRFRPGRPDDRGQPDVFAPGLQQAAFEVTFRNRLVWQLDGSRVQASRRSASCLPPEITSQPETTAEQGRLYRYNLEAGNGPGLTYQLLEAPEGMKINRRGRIRWRPTQLPGSYPVTVEVTNTAGSTTQQFSIELMEARRIRTISPVLECVVDRGADWTDPATRYVARFGYNNRNRFEVAVPIDSDNRFSPLPAERDQPTIFLPRRQVAVFEVVFSGDNLVWTLNGRSATASERSARCAP
jgi:hypothetical protein